jgi:hypothetical protein
MSRAEVEAKFRGNASLAISDLQGTRVIGLVGDITSQPDVHALMRSLAA